MIKAKGNLGQSLVEFALTIPIFLLIVLVFIDLGRVVYYYSALNNAVREGARQATILRFSNDAQRQTAIKNMVLSYAIVVPLTTSDISVYCDKNPADFGNPCDEYVTVSALGSFTPVTFFLGQIVGGGNTIDLEAESTMQMSPYGKYK